MENNERVVTIRTYTSVVEAQISQSLLNSAGIPAVLNHDVMASVLPAFGGLFEVGLMIAEQDRERAEQILDSAVDSTDFNAASESSQADADSE